MLRCQWPFGRPQWRRSGRQWAETPSRHRGGCPAAVRAYQRGARRLRRSRRCQIRQAVDGSGARLQGRLPPHQLPDPLLDLLLVEQLAAGEAVDLTAKLGDPVFVGVLHLGLPRDQAGEQIIAEGEIGCGAGGPQGHHQQAGDRKPEHDRADADLAAGVGESVAARCFGGTGTRVLACAPRVLGRGLAGGTLARTGLVRHRRSRCP
jgi:hypothetical protein